MIQKNGLKLGFVGKKILSARHASVGQVLAGIEFSQQKVTDDAAVTMDIKNM